MSRQYTDEFREESVRLALGNSSSIAQVARDLGVSVWTLRGWVRKYRQKSGSGEVRRAETVEEENRRLKRELCILRQERDILKKAAAYFAKEQL
jgi:transposase